MEGWWDVWKGFLSLPYPLTLRGTERSRMRQEDLNYFVSSNFHRHHQKLSYVGPECFSHIGRNNKRQML